MPGQKLNLRLQAQGVSPTTLRARVWLAGQPEPTTWQVTATDSAPELQVAGGIGIGGYSPASTGNGPIVSTWDDISRPRDRVVTQAHGGRSPETSSTLEGPSVHLTLRVRPVRSPIDASGG